MPPELLCRRTAVLVRAYFQQPPDAPPPVLPPRHQRLGLGLGDGPGWEENTGQGFQAECQGVQVAVSADTSTILRSGVLPVVALGRACNDPASSSSYQPSCCTQSRALRGGCIWAELSGLTVV